MEGTGGARKLRWRAKGRGKPGGVRVITFSGVPDVRVFLLAIFSKGERANLSKAERNELRQVLARSAEEYRKGSGRSLAFQSNVRDRTARIIFKANISVASLVTAAPLHFTPCGLV